MGGININKKLIIILSSLFLCLIVVFFITNNIGYFNSNKKIVIKKNNDMIYKNSVDRDNYLKNFENQAEIKNVKPNYITENESGYKGVFLENNKELLDVVSLDEMIQIEQDITTSKYIKSNASKIKRCEIKKGSVEKSKGDITLELRIIFKDQSEKIFKLTIVRNDSGFNVIWIDNSKK